jgi:hypothetical protein
VRNEDEMFPDGWEDSAIVSSLIQNKDGSLTVNIQIDVDSDDGRQWQVFRKIRMQRYYYDAEATTK